MTERPTFRVVSGGATAEEIAAATVVLEGALEQLALDEESSTPTSRSRWARSQISLRETIVPGAGQWGATVR